MILPFDLSEDLIIVPVRVLGPRRELILRFALDTAATNSMLAWSEAVRLGYDPSTVADQMEVVTASGVVLAPKLTVRRFVALGHERQNISVICQMLPRAIKADGVLGLDFFQGRRLTLDFRVGLVMLD